MKVLITEEQLKLIIREKKEDEYIPIPKEKVDAYKALTDYANSKGVKLKQLSQFKNYPNQTEELSDNPWDYNELVSGAIAHNRAINSKSFENLIGKRQKRQMLNKKNDLSIEELDTLRQLVDIISEIQKHGIKVWRVTGGDDFSHRSSTTNHRRARSIDFTLVDGKDEETHRKLESIVGKLIAKHSYLKDNLVFANEYYYGSADKSGDHIHLVLNPKGGDPSKFKFEKDIDGEILGKGNHKTINQQIADKYKGKEIVFDEVIPEPQKDEPEVIVKTTRTPAEDREKPLIINDFNLKTGIMSIDLDKITSGVAFSLFKKDKNGKFIRVPTFETKGGRAMPNTLSIKTKKSNVMYSGSEVLHFQLKGQIPYYDNWDKNYYTKGGDEFTPINGDEVLKFMVQRQFDDKLIGKPTSSEEFYINEKGEMSQQKFTKYELLKPIPVDGSSECKPKGRVISPMTLITPQNPEGLPYVDWDWCDTKTKGDSYMGTTIYVDSKGREVVVNTSNK